MCGVIIVFFAFNSGLSDNIGSTDTTSKAAPAIFPSFKAIAKSFSFINPPLEVFINKALSFIKEIESLFIISSVSSVKGQCRLIMSESLNRLSKSANLTISFSNSSLGVLAFARTFIPKACAISPTFWPILP